jgi:voltage-gated potassium channel
MIIQILFSLAIILVTIFIHGVGTVWWLTNFLRKHVIINQVFGFIKSLKILSYTAVFFLLLHYMEIALWAAVYMAIPVIDKISNWEEGIYFSTVTYTTLGYGDITLPPVWRIMSGFEALNGILLVGWTTTIFFAVVQKIVTVKYIKK